MLVTTQTLLYRMYVDYYLRVDSILTAMIYTVPIIDNVTLPIECRNLSLSKRPTLAPKPAQKPTTRPPATVTPSCHRHTQMQ